MQPYVSVVRLAGRYTAMVSEPKGIRFVVDYLGTDVRVAQIAAEQFSTTNQVLYNRDLHGLNKPIITVIQSRAQWFPAELETDKYTLITTFGAVELGGDGSQKEAVDMGEIIAMSRRLAFIPSLGTLMQSV